MPFAFEKCLADVAVQNWGDNIQSDILSVSACLPACMQGTNGSTSNPCHCA